MLSFIVRRFLSAIPTILILIVISFILMRLAPGSPFSSERGLSPEVLANLEIKYGLNQPWWSQLVNYLKGILFVHLGDLLPLMAVGRRCIPDAVGSDRKCHHVDLYCASYR